MEIIISIHALTWRATCFLAPLVHNKRDFYPRPHVEGDLQRWEVMIGGTISIHALTWRATQLSQSLTSASFYFYPRPHVEGD